MIAFSLAKRLDLKSKIQFICIFSFLTFSQATFAQETTALKTIDDLFEIQIAPLQEYFENLHRIRILIQKPDNTYLFNLHTDRMTGSSFFRILISRERKNGKLRETVDYFSKTIFSARLDLIREGEDIEETPDQDLLRGYFPPPKNEKSYALYSSLLGFEIRVKNTEGKRSALFIFENGKVRYSVNEEISVARKTYRYEAYIWGTQVGITPQVELVRNGENWEPQFFVSPRRDRLSPATFISYFQGLFGYIFQYKCLFTSKIKEKSWPMDNFNGCSGISISYPGE